MKQDIKLNKPCIIEYHGSNIKPNDSRWEKACEVNWLQTDAGVREAIKLQLENLILTYGLELVQKVTESYDIYLYEGGES